MTTRVSAGLILTLKPRERFLVGGNLVENGPRRSSIRILEDGTFVLRLSDALHPEEVRTPVTRTYHAAQRILACEVAEEDGREVLSTRLAELAPIFARTSGAETMQATLEGAAARRYHAVLRALKDLIPIEATLLMTEETNQKFA